MYALVYKFFFFNIPKSFTCSHPSKEKIAFKIAAKIASVNGPYC